MELSSAKIFSIATMLFASLVIEVIAEQRLEQLNVIDEASAGVQQRDKRYVLFPQYTVLQFTMAIVMPMEVPQRKIAMNVGLQCNFNLPYTAKEFYKPPFWDTRSLDEHGPASGNGTSRSSRSLLPVRADSCRETQANLLSLNDFSAEDFYSMVQNYLEKEGFEEDCLAKAICEMSRHPLEHQHDNLMTEMLYFLFSPSQHKEAFNGDQAFKLNEAEQHGLNSADCNAIYQCLQSPLDQLTVLEEEEWEGGQDADINLTPRK